MPQITVNEIDQSVVTRVVSDDRVKVLCPIIASFGPAFDGTQNSVQTFTDVTDFNRAFGYTYAEFDPFTNDYSRMYARELIKKGAAVSVVKINNNGQTAEMNIDGFSASRATASAKTICPAVMRSADFETEPKLTATATSGTQIQTDLPLPGTITVTYKNVPYTDDGVIYDNAGVKTGYVYTDDTKLATIVYADTGVTITVESAVTSDVSGITYQYLQNGNDATKMAKYTFCPQIQGIEAKYAGSFGNNIMISITQINTSRLAESYQYASISVYYIDQEVNYKYNSIIGQTVVSSRIVKGTTLLENKMVSTNPNDANYFEDVEFDFIRIVPIPGARDQLTLVWSNIEAAPQSSAQYSGFPVIPFKYKDANGYSTNYNFDAMFNKTFGTDFAYSTDVLDKLKLGFKGYWTGSQWSVTDVNNYLEDVYGDSGIVTYIYTQLSDVYQNFKDPYIYDFDFITSSGFVYEQYKLEPQQKKTAYTGSAIAITDNEGTISTLGNGIVFGTITITGTKDTTTVTIKDVVDGGGKTGTLKINGEGDSVGSVNYETGAVALLAAASITSASITAYSYYTDDTTVPKTASVIYPKYSGTGLNTAQYTALTPIHEAMKALTEARQDCIALYDVPRDYDVNAIVEYSRMLNTSYGTMHHPWCWVMSPDIAGKQILMAPSYIFMYTFLSNLIDNVDSQKWFPPAGVTRATARVVKRPDYEIGSVILNEWQNDNTSRVNPIMKLKQYGYVIYGQYTTLEAIDLYTHSALESLNVRLIANVVKKRIFDVCMNLAFDPNTATLWLKFYAQMDEFLRYMKYNEGVYDYRIVMDESTVTTDDINHLKCPGKVYIAPTRTAEFFDIDFIITEAGAIFTQD